MNSAFAFESAIALVASAVFFALAITLVCGRLARRLRSKRLDAPQRTAAAPPTRRPTEPPCGQLTRDEAVEALRQAEAKYRGIFENAVEGIFQTSPDGKYLSANPALARIYDYDSPEQLIESIGDIERQLYVDAERRHDFVRIMADEGVVSNFESQIYRRNGSVIWISEAPGRFATRGGIWSITKGPWSTSVAGNNPRRCFAKRRPPVTPRASSWPT
jgi:PAS domain S-box-containing protein